MSCWKMPAVLISLGSAGTPQKRMRVKVNVFSLCFDYHGIDVTSSKHCMFRWATGWLNNKERPTLRVHSFMPLPGGL